MNIEFPDESCYMLLRQKKKIQSTLKLSQLQLNIKKNQQNNKQTKN